MSLLEDLRSVDLFEDLTDAELEQWAAVAQPRDVEDGELLLEQGVRSPGLLLLFEGDVNTQVSVDGHFEPGTQNTGPTWIGAIAALTETALPINALAAGPCRIAIVPRAVVHRPGADAPLGPPARDARDRAGDARHQLARGQPRTAHVARHDGRGARARAQQPGRRGAPRGG